MPGLELGVRAEARDAPPTAKRALSGTAISRAAAATVSAKRSLATNAFASQSFTM